MAVAFAAVRARSVVPLLVARVLLGWDGPAD
jgi:hypothetical protein